MAQRRTISKVFVRNWVNRRAKYWIWQDCLRRSFIRRNKIWKISKLKTLGTEIESGRCSTTTESTTWFCSSKKIIQKMARRTCDKDETRKKNHSSRPTSVRQQREQAFERTYHHDHRVDPRTGWLFYKESQGDLSPSSSSTNWDRNNWTTKKLEFLAFFTVWQFVNNLLFCEFKTSSSCREMNSPPIDGECEQNTHSYRMYRCAQCISTSNCTIGSLFITRTRVTQGRTAQALVCPEIVCHPRVMSRSLQHLTLTTRTSSFSPTSPIWQSSSSTHSSLLMHDPFLHCEDSRLRGGSSEIPSPSYTELMIHRINDSEQEFCVSSIRTEVHGFFSFQRSQNSKTQCTGTCEDWVTCLIESLYHLRRYWIPLSCRRLLCFSIPLLFISGAPARISSRTSWLFFWIWSTNLIVSFSCQINIVEQLIWRWSSLWISQSSMFRFVNHPRSVEESAMTQMLGRYSTRIQLLLHRFQVIPNKKRSLKILLLDLPIL